MSLDRLKERAKKKGWPKHKLDAKVKRREKAREAASSVTGMLIRPVVSGVLNAVPFGGFAAAAVAKLPAVGKVPVLKEALQEGADQWEEKMAGGDMLAALGKDLLPGKEYIENGEWGKVAATYGMLALVLAVVYFVG